MQTKYQKKRQSKMLILNLISAAAVLAAMIWGIFTFFQIGNELSTNDAQVESYINPISTRIPGYIKEIRFAEHQQVHKGDTLIIIDEREYKIKVTEARSSLMDALANKDVATSGSDVASNGVSISDANLKELKARLVNMEINYNRYRSLLADDAVTQYQFDQVKTDYDAMRAKYDALQAQYQSSKLTTVETHHRVGVAEANILKARAMLDLANLNLSYTVITAPYDGIMGRRNIEEGQLLQTGQSLVSIVRGNEKWVTANFTEDQITSLQIGKSVEIKVDALPGRRFSGIIAAISEATGSRYSAIPVDNSTGNFVKVQQRIPVKINFKSAGSSDLHLLRTGMNVEVDAN